MVDINEAVTMDAVPPAPWPALLISFFAVVTPEKSNNIHFK